MFRLVPALLIATAAITFAKPPALVPAKIDDNESGLHATVFTFTPEKNRGFGILDLPDKSTAGTIGKHFELTVALRQSLCYYSSCPILAA
jgi:hypothetical protein